MNLSRGDILEPPPCSRVVNNGSEGRGSRRAIGPDGGAATRRSSFFVQVVMLMVSVTMVVVPPPAPW